MGKDKRTTRSGTVSASEGLYFEWGEKINMVIWNLQMCIRDRIYPAVRSTVAPSATDPGDAESLGEIGSSPVYTNDRLFIATYDAEGGQVISLNTNTNPPTQDWVFPNAVSYTHLDVYKRQDLVNLLG